MTVYTKPYLTVPDQIALLASRGMAIPDRSKAEEYLGRLGYYRLSAYWVPFREAHIAADGTTVLSDQFKPGTSFKTVVDLYAFDKALRLQLLDVLERIEISMRTNIALQLGRLDPWAHRDGRLLHTKFAKINPSKGKSKHSEWLARLDEKEESSKEEFANHFRRKYPSSKMPIWIAVELLDFGPLSIFLSGMRWNDGSMVAQKHQVPRADLCASWVRALCGVRNVCAHHARLWNKPLVDQPQLPRGGEIPLLDHLAGSPHANRRLYAACAIARYLLRVVNPRTKWPTRLREHLKAFPQSPHVSPKAMGFPVDWDQLPLWN